MKKRLLCGALLAAMLAATFTSCGGNGGNNTGSNNESTGETAQGEAYTPNPDEEPYNVKFLYLVAQEGDHYQDIVNAINEKCKEDINMTVEPITVTYGTIATTLNMMLPAAEALDVYTRFGSDQGTDLDSGYLLNWADYKQNLQDVIDYYGEDSLGACYIGDTWVVIPSNYERCAWTCFLVRDDIMAELGHSVDDYTGFDLSDPSTFDQLTELFAEVKEAHPEMVGISGTMAMGTQTVYEHDGLSDNFGVLMDPANSTEIVNYYETDIFRNICEINKTWFDAGYATADIATQQDSIEPILKAGNTFAGICNGKPNTVVEKLSQCGYPVNLIKISDTLLTSSNYTNGFCLSSASEDPAKAAAWYNWAFTSQEFNDLINWGLKGTDWVETEDGMADFPEGADVNSVGYHNDYGWIYPNQMVGHAWVGNEPDIWDQYVEFNKGNSVSNAFGFRWNSAPVINQFAACTAVRDQYIKGLVYGTVSDIDATIAEFNEALYGAGLQAIIDEKQSQFDAWRGAEG